jgi:hypothetical protein
MQSYTMEWDAQNLSGALQMGFNYIEAKDEIVGFVYANPTVLKRIVLAVPEEVSFDFIPDGIGMYRTAYLKRWSLRDDEIRFVNQGDTVRLRLFLR